MGLRNGPQRAILPDVAGQLQPPLLAGGTGHLRDANFRREAAMVAEPLLISRAHREVLFGSSNPMIAPTKAHNGLDGLKLSPETRALFLGGNA